jgi:Domain of unknown function (DUF4397)
MSARTYVVLGAVTTGLALTGPMPVSQAAQTGAVQIIQAVPDASVRVAIDGRRVKSGVGLGTVLGPYSLSSGKHSVRFVDPSGDVTMSASLTVRPGTSSDVVLHRPASVSGKPVVNVYSTPRKSIGPGKARVLVAHTATVAPADVRVDGKVIFTNIANGEYAEADVPAGSHKVELLPTGQKTNPILGPINVSLAPQTVTMVYAVGTPTNGSMKVIAHAADLSSDGTVEPGAITTGSAGLAAGARVTTFTTPQRGGAGTGVPLWAWAPAAAALVLLGGVLRRVRRPARRSALDGG